MKRITFNLFLLCAISFYLLSACSCRRGQTTNPGAVAAPTATPAGANLSPNQPAAQPPTTASAASTAGKSGWWIRVNTSLTTAQTITFQIGTGKLQREEWRVWRAGEPAEFDVPPNYAQAQRLYLRGSVSPIGKIADLCMMYKERGVEHMGFNEDESETKSQTQIDYKCR